MGQHSEDWIEWAGGECPVADQPVDARLRNGNQYIGFRGDRVLGFWDRDGARERRTDIIAYRVVQS